MRTLTALLTTALLVNPALSLTADVTTANRAEGGAGTTLQALARNFFAWRRIQQPAQGDDIPRVERPDGWLPDFSADALENYRQKYEYFLAAVNGLDTTRWSVEEQVDARLLRAAIQRVH